MRINDGSICGECLNFDHNCEEDYCWENCECKKDKVTDMFYDFDEIILDCEEFKI